MRAGMYRWRATIRKPTKIADAANELSETWADALVVNLPCSIEAVAGGETQRGQQTQAAATHVIHASYPMTKGIDTTMRLEIVEEGATRLLNIVRAYDPDGRQRDRVIECEELA